MKLEPTDIGKKFKYYMWTNDRFFLLLGFTSKGECLGENHKGGGEVYPNHEEWSEVIDKNEKKKYLTPSEQIVKHSQIYGPIPEPTDRLHGQFNLLNAILWYLDQNPPIKCPHLKFSCHGQCMNCGKQLEDILKDKIK